MSETVMWRVTFVTSKGEFRAFQRSVNPYMAMTKAYDALKRTRIGIENAEVKSIQAYDEDTYEAFYAMSSTLIDLIMSPCDINALERAIDEATEGALS